VIRPRRHGRGAGRKDGREKGKGGTRGVYLNVVGTENAVSRTGDILLRDPTWVSAGYLAFEASARSRR